MTPPSSPFATREPGLVQPHQLIDLIGLRLVRSDRCAPRMTYKLTLDLSACRTVTCGRDERDGRRGGGELPRLLPALLRLSYFRLVMFTV
jgi:hypothetical protein